MSRRNQVTKSIWDKAQKQIFYVFWISSFFQWTYLKHSWNVEISISMTDNFERLLSKCRSFPFWSHISAITDDMTSLITAVNPKTITCTLLLMTNCIWNWMNFLKKNLISMSELSESSKDLLQIKMKRDTSKKCYSTKTFLTLLRNCILKRNIKVQRYLLTRTLQTPF